MVYHRPPGCRRGKREEEGEEEDDEWALPEGVEPFLAAAPLYTGGWVGGRALLVVSERGI